MSRIIELLGLLAPLIVLSILLLNRQRAPFPVAVGVVGATVVATGTLTELVAHRAAWFGGGGMEGAIDRLEGWGLVRFCLVAIGALLLTAAAFIGGGRTAPRVPLAIGGIASAVLGNAMRFVHLDLDGAGRITRVLTAIALDIVQFGLLGAGLILLGIAVVSGRDDGPEPLDQSITFVRRGLHTLGSVRGKRRR